VGDLIEILKQFGVPMGLVILFVWEGRQREHRMTDRLQLVEDYIRGELREIARQSIEVIKEQKHSTEENTATLMNLTRALGQRPCLLNGQSADGQSAAVRPPVIGGGAG